MHWGCCISLSLARKVSGMPLIMLCLQLPPIEAHDVLVKSGGMSQILLWTSFLEIFGGIALFQTIQGKRYPGDFQFDPLGLSQVHCSA